jgi:hypothetical protein
VPPNVRISLWPEDGESLGLLLNRSEFDEVVECFPEPVCLDFTLQDMLFSWTAGHAGATADVLDIITQKASHFRGGFLVAFV